MQTYHVDFLAIWWLYIYNKGGCGAASPCPMMLLETCRERPILMPRNRSLNSRVKRTSRVCSSHLTTAASVVCAVPNVVKRQCSVRATNIVTKVLKPPVKIKSQSRSLAKLTATDRRAQPNEEWPSPSCRHCCNNTWFWQHEWQKHGRYFAAALSLKERVDILYALENRDIKPNGSNSSLYALYFRFLS